MNELDGPFVIIVLNIREGRGFDFLQQPLSIEASLNNSKIQSDAVSPAPMPAICTELVWETEKREVRKLRSSHVPLRVDCFTTDEDHQKLRIGFILLSLRSAQAVAGNQVSPVAHRWHKLSGIPSKFRATRPELEITLTIRDRVYQQMQTMHPAVNTCIEQVVSEEVLHTDSDRPVIVPIMYLDDGCIRIGENCPSLQRFTLTLQIGTASNLDLLLPASKVFQQNKDKYCISLYVLGMTINTKCFSKNIQDPIVLNDRIAIKLDSTAQILKLFFDQYQQVPVHFCHGKEILATAEIDFNEFLNIEQLENTAECKAAQECSFHIGENRDIPVGIEGRQPSVHIEAVLNHYPNNSSPTPNTSVSNSVDSFNNNSATPDTKHACGDQKRHRAPRTLTGEKSIGQPREDAAVQTTPRDEQIVAVTALKSVPNLRRGGSHCRLTLTFDDLANYYLYDLTVTLRSITWRKALGIDGFLFRFRHPTANNAVEIQCEFNGMACGTISKLIDVFCRTYYLSTEANIKSFIALHPIQAAMCKLDGTQIADGFQLYTKMFLSQPNNNNTCVYYAILHETDNEDSLLCDVQIEMTINKHDLNEELNTADRDYTLDPVVLDDWFAVKTTKDLQDWKQSQERKFTENLNRLQSEKLQCLQSDWTKKRVSLEGKLQEGLEKCKVLHHELSLTANEMKSRNAFCQRNELCSSENREAIELRVTQMLQDEMNRTVDRMKREKQSMAEEIKELSDQKALVQNTMRENAQQLEELRKTTLTQEQTASLFQEMRALEEKHQQALATKAFFKEQWQKALSEVHALKSEDQRQIQQEIRRAKEELSQFNIDASDAAIYCPAEREHAYAEAFAGSAGTPPVGSYIF